VTYAVKENVMAVPKDAFLSREPSDQFNWRQLRHSGFGVDRG